MSLIGLDDPKVKEAHDAAISEPGGWFLLEYVTRDEVDILGRGTGGILEIRNAIATYEEASPLFGFLKYRRRNVLIKYVPEDCSRLIQARVTVHFNAVTDRFSPYDTSFSIDTAKGLKDSALSAACSLHTASGSTSSSTSSLRRRRLMEIAEDEEEDRRQSTVIEERASTIRSSSIDGHSISALGDPSTAETPELLSSMTYQPPGVETTIEQDPDLPDLTPTFSDDPSIHSSSDHLSESSRQPFDQEQQYLPDDPLDSSNYNSYPTPGRPKMKLGPRPSLDTAGRSQISSSTNYRQVSTLPANVKLFSRSSKRPKERPQSQHPSTTPTMTISPPNNVDATTNHDNSVTRPYSSGGRPTTSSGVSYASTLSTNTVTSKVPTMTPEKARLMKAMEMRKKKKNAIQAELLVPVPPSNGLNEEEKQDNSASDVALGLEEEPAPPLQNGSEEVPEITLAASSRSITADSDVTGNGSTPATPLTLSDEEKSTRASSVSDSTDETIQAHNESNKTITLDDGSHNVKTASPDNNQDLDQSEQDPSQTPPKLENPITMDETTDDVQHTPVLGVEPLTTQGQEALKLMVLDTSEDLPVAEEALVDSDLPTNVAQNTSIGGSYPELKVEGLSINTEISEVVSPSEHITIADSQSSTLPAQVEDDANDDRNVLDSEDITENSLEVAKTTIKIPKSKFSAQTTDGPKAESNRSVNEPKANYPKGDLQINPQRRQRLLVEPIRTDMSRPTSEVDLLNDDALMDELQSATVQEAQPISVSKSPMTPSFPKKGPSVSDRFSRAFSNPLKKESEKLAPQQLDPPRSVSASAYLNRISQQNMTPPVIKKVNVGSGISQRIKALEKLSSTNATPVPPQSAGSIGPASTFFAVRKSPSAAGSKSPSIADKASSLTRRSPSPSISRESSPEQYKNKHDAFNSSPTNTHTSVRPGSVSVTARIVRDPAQSSQTKYDLGRDPLDHTRPSLQQSPLVIDQIVSKSPAEGQQPMKEMIEAKELPSSQQPIKNERRSSATVVKELISETRSSLAERRKSMTIEPSIIASAMASMRSPSRSSSVHPGSPNMGRPPSVSSRRSSRDYGSVRSPAPSILSPSTSEENIEKKGSRASRMLHRMSSSLSSSRKTIVHAMSPTVREESEPSPVGVSMSPSNDPTISGPITTMIEMGDVNVQFPDNLLWKRRAMRLDSQGFLILTQSQAGKVTDKTAGVKKYHLSDFRTPAIPDMEAEELPNSVVLDFVDGSGLQLACEDRGGQVWVLQKLLEAHSTWAAYGQ